MRRRSKILRYAGITVTVILCLVFMMKIQSMLASGPEAAYSLITILPIVAWYYGRRSLRRITRHVPITAPTQDRLDNPTILRYKELIGDLPHESAKVLYNRLDSIIERFGSFWIALGFVFVIVYGPLSTPYSDLAHPKPNSVFEVLDVRYFGFVYDSDGRTWFQYHGIVQEWLSYLLRLLPVIVGIIAASKSYRAFDSWRTLLWEKAHPDWHPLGDHLLR